MYIISNNKFLTSKMQLLALVLMFYFLVGACICLLICVNPNQPGLLSAANRFVFVRIPQIFSSVITRLFGPRILNVFSSIKNYLLYSNHPIVQFFYLLIAVFGYAFALLRFCCYQIYGILKHMPSPSIHNYHMVIANVLALLSFYVYYKACAVGPGEITDSNISGKIKQNEMYYDEVLYMRDNQCKSCEKCKPARSKHCSICKMCVSRYDHHCVWIRQCVGEYNYKYFVSFLFIHAVWCLYLSIIGYVALREYLDRINFWNMSFNVEGTQVKANVLVAFQFLLMSETVFFFLIVMCAIMGVTLVIFVSYHFYLIKQGQTTNERIKRNDQISYLQKEIKAIIKVQIQNKNKGNEKIKFKSTQTTLKQLEEFRHQCYDRLKILNKGYPNKGFWRNLVQIFKK